MSEAEPSAVTDWDAPSINVKRIIRWCMWGCVLISLAVVGWGYAQYWPAIEGEEIANKVAIRSSGVIDQPAKHLAPGFTDSQGRLLADPPTSPDQFADPATIVLGRWEPTSDTRPDIAWQAFEKHLSEAIGRPVKEINYDNSAAQIEQLKKGEITLVALHAADAPFLVNNCGYQPAAVLADDSNAISGNRLDIIVPPKSAIQSPADLRDHTLVCAVPASITGYRAAVALLMHDERLRPNVDYIITFSLKQKASIKGVTQNKFEAAAVSDDKLRSMLDSGKVTKDQFRAVYQSEVIPRMTIGWFYNLKPELADKIRQAILSYKPTPVKIASSKPTTDPSGGDADAAADADSTQESGMLHWIPTDYKKDFQLVRTIDDLFDPRLDTKAVK
ncbi:MAG: PhnD/SsuA/transferrin family substrate-binding protein [Phycisphaerae bacterium]|nr:PhnD/SsuA/transferrin family substrate-binding protein [Phycisphaerae bacterium]